MLALLLTVSIYTNLVTISNNLDVAYENVIRNDPGVAKDIDNILEDIKYNRHLIELTTVQDVEYMTILDLFYLSALQLKDYESTDNMVLYKNSISNKIYADTLLYTENKK